MKLRFPLYAKILLWFFLNVVFLAVTFLIVASVQFHFGLDQLVSGPAGERLQAVSQLVAPEISDAPRPEWDRILKRFSDAYRVEFYLFRNESNRPEQLAGNPVELPPEVRNRVMEFRGPGALGGRGGAGRMGGGPPADGGPQPFRPPGGPGERPMLGPGNPPPRFMLHTRGPSRYWVLMPARGRPPGALGNPEPPGPGGPAGLPGPPLVLIICSETLSAGGLFFDPKPWVLAGIGVVVISALFWFPLVRGITRSISQMTRATERMAEGKFEARTQVERQDELGYLSEAIDGMAERLAGFVTGQKRFLGDIAHELCSPIARMQVALGILEQQAEEKQMARLDDLREEVEHMSSLVNELLSFSRAALGRGDVRLQPVLLRGLVQKAVDRECDPEEGVEVRMDVAEDLRVLAEPDLLLRAIANVLRNALRYAAHAGPISIVAAKDHEGVTLSIEDCGPGIPADSLAQVFDPFYRVDSSRTRETGGVGLGLSIVKTCVESCGGTVSCENRQPSGLRVILRLSAVGSKTEQE